MNCQRDNLRLFLCFFAAVLFFLGCAAQMQRPMQVCPGAGSAAEAISILTGRLENALPVKANGRCLLDYYVDGKRHKENFAVKLWVNPPAQIYLQGDVAFDPKGIVAGSNEKQFWLAVKPKEIDSYWWGRWADEKSCTEELMISPQLLLEALGFMALVDEGNWSLSNEGAFDVLTKRSRSIIARRIYIYGCDYLTRRIEYLDTDQTAVVVTELDKYKEVHEGVFVPTVIKIVRHTESVDARVSITFGLKSIKPVDLTDEQICRLFTRPEPRGFGHIYKIVDGNIIEEKLKN